MFSRILIPLDGSPLAESVLPHAEAISLSDRTEIHLLRVVNPAPAAPGFHSGDPLEWKLRKAEAEAYLYGISERFHRLGIETRIEVGEGKPAETIIEYALTHAVDLILISSHGSSGLTGWNMSSVVQKVILRARTSIMLIRAYQAIPDKTFRYDRLLLPLDGSLRAESVLPIAVEFARAWEADLFVAHAIARPEMPRRRPLSPDETALADKLVECNRVEAAHYLSELKRHFDFPLETHLLVTDQVAASLHRFVHEQGVDLVVTAAHGFAGAADWPYGSVATTFLVYGTTPLLVYQDMPAENIRTTPAETAAKEHGDR